MRRRQLQPRILEKAYLDEKTDREIFNEMGELGLLGVTIPEAYGGAGAAMSPMGSSRVRSSASIPAIAR
jgi:glutaryl-CoA dehydrogenase